MNNPKTTILGYLAVASAISSLLAGVSPGKWGPYILAVGAALNGAASVLAKDGGH